MRSVLFKNQIQMHTGCEGKDLDNLNKAAGQLTVSLRDAYSMILQHSGCMQVFCPISTSATVQRLPGTEFSADAYADALASEH